MRRAALGTDGGAAVCFRTSYVRRGLNSAFIAPALSSKELISELLSHCSTFVTSCGSAKG